MRKFHKNPENAENLKKKYKLVWIFLFLNKKLLKIGNLVHIIYYRILH